VKCHPNCDVCDGPSKKCAKCAGGAVRFLDTYCEDWCPSNYKLDPVT